LLIAILPIKSPALNQAEPRSHYHSLRRLINVFPFNLFNLFNPFNVDLLAALFRDNPLDSWCNLPSEISTNRAHSTTFNRWKGTPHFHPFDL